MTDDMHTGWDKYTNRSCSLRLASGRDLSKWYTNVHDSLESVEISVVETYSIIVYGIRRLTDCLFSEPDNGSNKQIFRVQSISVRLLIFADVWIGT